MTLASALGLDAIAEGVEPPKPTSCEIWAVPTRRGYFFGRPDPSSQMDRLFSSAREAKKRAGLPITRA